MEEAFRAVLWHIKVCIAHRLSLAVPHLCVVCVHAPQVRFHEYRVGLVSKGDANEAHLSLP